MNMHASLEAGSRSHAVCEDLAENCLVCAATGETGGELAPVFSDIADYEYGIGRKATYHQCSACGFVMQLPRVPASEIPALYPEDYQTYAKPGKSLFGAMKAWLVRNDAKRVAELATTNAPRILEIGCGNGALLEAVLDVRPGAYACGVDIADVGLSSHDRIDFRLGQLEEVDLPPGSFDVIYCSNLIEHVADPIAFMVRAQAMLKPGGHFVIVTPNHRSLDRLVFGKRWGGYHFPRHLMLFDDRNLRKALQANGFEVERISGGHAWWAISFRNCLYAESARRKRGLVFVAISLAFAPLDLLLNVIRRHGSMTAVARRNG
ncbi:MAG: class I SAM-dependent methyltransferase [Novosphingobium sp.]|nr:class I SAM-dependent methyltransferase [Novosphingobium sp.]